MKVKIPKVVLDAYSVCYKKNGDFNSRKFSFLAKLDSRIQDWFASISSKFSFEVTPLLVYYSSIAKKLDTYSPVLCKVCGKILTVSQVKNDSYCSVKCAAQSSEVRNKTKSTMLSKYGSEHALQVKQFQDKFKSTCLDKYGTENPYASKEVKHKIKATLAERYGNDNPNKIESIKKKIKETNLKKYGTENPAVSKTVREKIEKTCKDRYKSKSPLGSKEIQTKSKETWLKTLGVDSPAKSKKVFNKIKATNLERYGVEIASKNKDVIEKGRKTQRENFYDFFVAILEAKKIQLLTSKDDYIEHKPLTFKCLACGAIWTNINLKYGDNYQQIICENCRSKKFSSNAEKQVVEFIKSIYSGTVLENNRTIIKNAELDIYLPDKKIAIEFNGTFYHSSLFKDYKYHQNKTLACREKGIRLIHIFEYEWTFKQEKVKNLIKTALGVFDQVLYARQCLVKELSSNDYIAFLEINHFNGAVNSSIRYGLFYKDELVSVIGFGKSRFKRGETELHRFCNKASYRIIGGFSKLLKHSKQTHFFSYVDLAHFDGKGYDALGFSLIKITSPSYVYVKKDKVLNRIACQKHKLNNLLNRFNSNLTEQQNMSMNGYYQIYDCGNLKLEYKV